MRLGCAPDTFLGAGGRLARHMIDDGRVGRIIAGSAFLMSRGMEHWHPNPQFYYQPGGGPVFDMGPYYLTMLVNLLGPVERVMAMATRGQEERLISAEGPFKNTTFKVGTRRTIFSFYLFIVIYLVGGFLLDKLPAMHPQLIDPLTQQLRQARTGLTSQVTAG